MGAIPFLQPFHALPLTSFYGEWVAIALGLGACIAMLTSRFLGIICHSQDCIAHTGVNRVNRHPEIRSGTCLHDTNSLPALYLAWTALLATMAAWLRRQFERKRSWQFWRGSFSPAGIFQAFAGIMQYLGLHDWLGAAITPQTIAQHLRQSRTAESLCNVHHARPAGAHLFVRPASAAVGNHDPGIIVVRVCADAVQLARGRNICAKRVCPVPACLSQNARSRPVTARPREQPPADALSGGANIRSVPE